MSQRLKAATLAVLCIAIGNGAFAQTTRVSVATGGAQATGGDSQDTAISADGRFVAFSSRQPNLVGGDTNNATDVLVHDRCRH